MMLLDEPTAGMAHDDVERITALIRKVAANRTVLMVEHNLSVVSTLSDHITVLARGEVLAQGDYADGVEEPRRSSKRIWARLMPEAPGALDPRTLPAATDPCSACASSTRGTANRTSCTASTFDVAARRGRDAARAQRRRQDHDAQVDHGHRDAAQGLDPVRRQGDDRACRPTASRAWASRSAPRSAASSRASTSRRICCCRRRCKEGGLTVEQIFELFPNLKERLHSQGTKLSGGEQQMLAIGRILRTGAHLLMLDEPTEGLAPVIVQQIGRTIAQAEGERASRSCWSSRTSGSRRPSRTGTTSWSTGASST